ncbi:hypothetical protein HN803_03395 [candidate division WWE3 bacterium]|jgi:uncharacterized protein YacL|nr:hypothetical protein [candidate division WWE3 bacterium]
MPAKKKTKIEKKSNFVARALQNPRVWGFIFRSGLFATFFILAFNTASTTFFNDNPIFHVQFLAETVIGLAFGVFGFHTVPIIAEKSREWFENVLAKVVYDIVTDFWNEQSKRMSDARRTKQKEKKKEREKKAHEQFKTALLVDTSVLIDGRIIEMVKAGFMDAEMIVPKGVVDELHLISDSNDDLKRAKGRRGLDMLNNLKKVTKVKIYSAPGDITKDEGVDKELVRLAKKYKGKLMTLDYNLNKVAKTANVTVLNVNELANAIKFPAIPGEKLKVKIVKAGKERKQGLAYMEDGTMLVVEGAKDKVGKRLTVTVSKIIQTDAGKMVFCEL